MAQRTHIPFRLPHLGLLAASALFAGCAAPTRPLSVPPSHPASVDAPETPLPPPSTTLQIPPQAGGR